MGVTQRHVHITVAEQPRDDRHRHAVHDRVARMRMAQVVEADILDAGFPTDPIPEPKFEAAWAGRIGRRGKHESAPAPGLS